MPPTWLDYKNRSSELCFVCSLHQLVDLIRIIPVFLMNFSEVLASKNLRQRRPVPCLPGIMARHGIGLCPHFIAPSCRCSQKHSINTSRPLYSPPPFSAPHRLPLWGFGTLPFRLEHGDFWHDRIALEEPAEEILLISI
ncbi:hypothetical protein ONS95_002322 [Cadophora gregata]|uniref:uncharacterized protein n=1 Tax=Cadophora gregata TaxID=51156 RepID=UPI0026DA6FCA|nr:uncharacterized protein ONS95_002322 [Cadophora gregata]KAK0109641.1 hypothetical protein ONS95_002322 [Cadophora gregata]KAK0110728.1 hypothetical protein ONS96_002327 [Cadophora gregata f. sp. sojae]